MLYNGVQGPGSQNMAQAESSQSAPTQDELMKKKATNAANLKTAAGAASSMADGAGWEGTSMGLQAGSAFGPYGMLFGGLGGMTYDLFTKPDQVLDASKNASNNRDTWNKLNDPYAGNGYGQSDPSSLGYFAQPMPVFAMGGTTKNPHYANGGPEGTQKTQLGISQERMAASDALAAQLEEQRTRQRPEAPNWSSRMDANGQWLQRGEGQTMPHDGRAYKGPFIGMPSGPPIDLNKYDGTAGSSWQPTYPIGYGYANGGPTHIVPQQNAGRATADAKVAGADLASPANMKGQAQGKVPGASGSTADDKTMSPSGQNIQTSSGEVLMSNDMMQRLSSIAGLSVEDYASVLYPDGKPGGSYASGGPTDPPKQPGLIDPNPKINSAAMSPEAAQRYNSLQTMLNGDWASIAPDYLGRLQNTTQNGTTPPAMAKTEENPVDKAGVEGQAKDADTQAPSSSYDQMQAWNRNAAIAASVPAIGAFGYNLFSKRTPATPPADYTPQKLDLQTNAYNAKLQNERARGTATALYNTRDKQGLGRDLGIVANDISARLNIAAAVEGVENQERSVNNQMANQAGLFNTQQRNQFMQQEAAMSNQFRAQKGQALTQNLGALTETLGGYYQNKIGIEDRKNLNKYQSDYLKYLSAEKGYETMTPADFYNSYAIADPSKQLQR